MGGGPFQKILDAIQAAGGNLLLYGLLALAVVVIFVIGWKLLGRKKGTSATKTADLTIDIAALGDFGPTTDEPTLEYYNIPVRLAAIVLAPTGRISELPPIDQLPALVDHMVPGMARVMAAHRPLIRRWPAQLSAEGFARTVFAAATLPGQRGKGSAWCNVAGRFKIDQQSFMAALIMVADAPNNFGESIVEKEHEWLGVLRVRG